jgi:tetratricopeptide (TPR) repeat protein
MLPRAFVPLFAVPFFLAAAGTAQAPAKYTHETAEKLYRAGHYAEDEALCNQAVADLEKSLGNKAWQIAEPLNDLATLYMRQSRLTDAKQAIERADSLLDKKVPAQALIYGRLGINKGWRLYVLGETDGGTKVFEEALALIEKYRPGESIDRAELINNLGLMYEAQAEKNEDDALMEKARACLFRGWEMRRDLTGDYSPETAESVNNLGMHLLFNGRDPEESEFAVKVLRKALEMAVKVYGESHPETAVAHATLGLALVLHGKSDEAEKEVRFAIPMTQKYLGDKHPDLAYEYMTLGHILQEQSHLDEAEKYFLDTLAIDEAVYGKTHQNVLPSLKALHDLYNEMGDPAKAQDVEKRIEKLNAKDI